MVGIRYGPRLPAPTYVRWSIMFRWPLGLKIIHSFWQYLIPNPTWCWMDWGGANKATVLFLISEDSSLDLATMPMLAGGIHKSHV